MPKRLIAFVAAFVLAFAIAGCSSGGSSTSSSSASSDASSSAEDSSSTSSEASTHSATEQFIEDYNANPNSGTDLEATETFDPTDKNGSHYRTEFRLTAWNDSKGQACSAGGVSVDIIEPKSGKIRVYASGPKDGVVEFYRTAAQVLDPQASDDAIEAAVQKGLDGFGGSGVSIEGSKLNTILETPSYKDDGEAMLEMS